MDPLTLMAISGGIQLAGNVLPKLIGAKGREKKLDAAAHSFTTPQEFKDNVADANAQVGAGDPNYNRNINTIKTGEANALDATKNAAGGVSDVLAAIQGLNRTSTDRQMATNAADTQFRLNAKRYLGQTRAQLGVAEQQTAARNFAAKQAEIQRQQQNQNAYAGASGNVANDFISANLLKDYKFLGQTPAVAI